MIEQFRDMALAYPLLAPLLFVLARAVPIIIPPIPGIGFDLIGIILFGWQWGLVFGLLGGMLGSAVAFYLTRRHRAWVLARMPLLATLHALEDRYSERQKFWTLVGVRLLTSPMFDYVNYVAGLTKMRFRSYMLSTFLGVLPYAFCVYYFGERVLAMGWLVGVCAFVVLMCGVGMLQHQLMQLSKEDTM